VNIGPKLRLDVSKGMLRNPDGRIAWSIMRRGGAYKEINELRAASQTG